MSAWDSCVIHVWDRYRGSDLPQQPEIFSYFLQRMMFRYLLCDCVLPISKWYAVTQSDRLTKGSRENRMHNVCNNPSTCTLKFFRVEGEDFILTNIDFKKAVFVGTFLPPH